MRFKDILLLIKVLQLLFDCSLTGSSTDSFKNKPKMSWRIGTKSNMYRWAKLKDFSEFLAGSGFCVRTLSLSDNVSFSTRSCESLANMCENISTVSLGWNPSQTINTDCDIVASWGTREVKFATQWQVPHIDNHRNAFKVYFKTHLIYSCPDKVNMSGCAS